jgi:hypothetical protein
MTVGKIRSTYGIHFRTWYYRKIIWMSSTFETKYNLNIILTDY